MNYGNVCIKLPDEIVYNINFANTTLRNDTSVFKYNINYFSFARIGSYRKFLYDIFNQSSAISLQELSDELYEHDYYLILVKHLDNINVFDVDYSRKLNHMTCNCNIINFKKLCDDYNNAK